MPRGSTFLLPSARQEVETTSSSPAGGSINATILENVQISKRRMMDCLRVADFPAALDSLRDILSQASFDSLSSREADQAVQTFTHLALAPPYHNRRAYERVIVGVKAIHLQLGSAMGAPYNTIPRGTLLSALRALTGLAEVRHLDATGGFSTTDEAFRVLQRLVTGVGVRTSQKTNLAEQDFNRVLNAYSNVGRMDMAHRIVALQERTKSAPPLSPVAYSILLKGYGRLKDLDNVKMSLSHARANQIEPDTVMLNSLIDAYVNCGQIEKAYEVFEWMKDPIRKTKNLDPNQLLARPERCPPPNRRTYNTLLKGFANSGKLKEAIVLSEEMRSLRLWDRVTTNTLVHAALVNKDFDFAESVLANHTMTKPASADKKQHPNVEAYTELLDEYGKAGKLEKALEVFKRMRQLGVKPNSFTYTCIIGALARQKKIGQANKMMDFMQKEGIKPSVVTYNAFISALVDSSPQPHNSKQTEVSLGEINGSAFDGYVTEAVLLFRKMIRAGVRPNSVTVSVIVDALGRCSHPRIEDAQNLVAKLEQDGIISPSDLKVSTALVRACGAVGDLQGSLAAFRKLERPDVIALNAFLGACCNCNREDIAFDTFGHYFRSENSARARLKPDAITYSILISAALKRRSSSHASQLYQQMKNVERIKPDKPLVDIILRALVRRGKDSGLHRRDVQFVAYVLRDAERLEWATGQLERRKRAVHVVITSTYRDESWARDPDISGLLKPDALEDVLFKRKGWNQVDSGFRLWGGDRDMKRTEKRAESGDAFLKSKGWNDVDSGFRII